jgi:hypothetical protein
MDCEDLLGALRIGGPGARDLFNEGFAGGGSESAGVGRIAVFEPAEERHAGAKAGGLVCEADPVRGDGEPPAVEEFLGRHGEGADARGVIERLLLSKEVVGFAGEAGLAPGGFECGFGGGVVGKMWPAARAAVLAWRRKLLNEKGGARGPAFCAAS